MVNALPTRHAPAKQYRLRQVAVGFVGLALLLVIAISLCEILEWPFLRHPLETKLSLLLGRPVSFGSQFGVRLIGSVRMHTNAMTIGPAPDGGPTLVDESGKPRDFLHADSVRLVLRYAALFDQWKSTDQPLNIKLLDVDSIEINLKRSADGHSNWQFGAGPSAASASTSQLPQFERLNVRSGEVRLEDQPLQIVMDAHLITREGSARAYLPVSSGSSTASNVHAATDDSSPASAAPQPMSPASTPPTAFRIAHASVGARIASDAAVALAGSAQPDDGRPGLRIDGTGSYRKAPLVIELRSSGLLPLAASDEDTPDVPIWLDAQAGKSRIRLDGAATDLLHFGGLDASFSASGPSLASVGDALGITLPTTADFKTNGRLKKRGGVWDADVASLDIGSSRLRGKFTFDGTAAVPKLTGMLGGARLALADLGPAFGAAAPGPPAVSAKPDSKARRNTAATGAGKAATKAGSLNAAAAPSTQPGKMLPDRQFDLPSLKAMNADVGVDLAVLDLGTNKLEPLTPLQGKITLEDGVLNLHDLLARTSMGAVQGAIGLDSRSSLPIWSADLRWSGIQLARFIKTKDTMVKKNADGARPAIGYVSGLLGGDAKLTGKGGSTAALLASINGTTRLWVQDGQVSHLLVESAGIDIADALGLYLKGDDQIPMQCAVAKLTLANGEVTPDVMVIDTHESTLIVTGGLSLAEETLNLKLKVHPHNFSPLAPRQFSPLAPRTPVDVDGTFSDPHVHLEAKPLLERGGFAIALGLINPLAALLALVDLRQPEKDVCARSVASLEKPDRPGAFAPTGSSARSGKPSRAASSSRAEH